MLRKGAISLEQAGPGPAQSRISRRTLAVGYVHRSDLVVCDRPRVIKTSPSLFGKDASFQNYADCAVTEEFHRPNYSSI